MSAVPRLGSRTLAQLPADVQRPAYARAVPAHGIVHIGIGAFHRAHQAAYTDDAIASGDRLWGITGVSLRHPAVAAQLNPQDGLYTLVIRGNAAPQQRVIGAVRGVLVAPENPRAVLDAIAAPATRLVSLTISEKGYCRRADGALDFALADDASVYRFLGQGLAARRAAGLPGITLLSCDNLSGNGAQLRGLLTQYLERAAPSLTAWFDTRCRCPGTMVDRIVPATTPADLGELALAFGVNDAAAVFTEPFTQWVIEDDFAVERPRWETGGAQFTRDVAPFETAKLRMLNGAHSALAYLGLARGHEFVHQAIADPPLRALVERLMLTEAATSFTPAPEQNLTAYAGALLERFANAALRHRLAQISMDGSQKIPQRWLATLAFHQRAGRGCPAILTALAAWISFVRGERWTVDDPRAAELAALWRTHDAAGVVDALFGVQGLFRDSWVAGSADRSALLQHLRNPAL